MHVVQNPPRSAHQDVDASPHGLLLRLIAGPAIDAVHLHPGRGQGLELQTHLRRGGGEGRRGREGEGGVVGSEE